MFPQLVSFKLDFFENYCMTKKFTSFNYTGMLFNGYVPSKLDFEYDGTLPGFYSYNASFNVLDF